jgi:4'-phosphopantetheinyl transferase
VTGTVRVWLIGTHLPSAAVDQCREVLDAGERARAADLDDPGDRLRFTVAHGALRILAGRELGVPPAELHWAAGPHGKPGLLPPWSGLHTSLSHSGAMVAAAVSTGRPVGVDIQQVVPGLDPVRLSARFFPAAEASYVADGAPGDQGDRFAALWARKEAVVKANGGRLWVNLRMPVRDRAVVCPVEPPGPHRVADFAAPPGFRAAVALTGAAAFTVRHVTAKEHGLWDPR